MSDTEFETIVRRCGEPTMRLKFIDGILNQLYIHTEYNYGNIAPNTYVWLPVEREGDGI